ncbi:MAG: oxygen-independent coproporphyrinogen III oxidase [Rhizobiaceae bacterium]
MFDPHAVLARYQKPVPRYTSYPTAPQFKGNVGSDVFARGLSQLDSEQSVSAYLHIPFCDRLCWFCGCHTKHTLKYAPIARYMQSLSAEVHLLKKHLSFRPHLGQLHLGGGSPSLLKRDELQMLREVLDSAFCIDEKTEISIEIDPSDVDAQSIDGLVEFGLTRASVGVQDFHPQVQQAINRPQSFEVTCDVIAGLRQAGVRSVNIDALYGLPLQSQSRLLKTIDQCIALKPDRMALFGYAHVPWLKKHQNMIKLQDLPGTNQRYDDAQAAAESLVDAGFQPIGIDHFAKPDDTLALAANAGRLQRNFQGYTTDSHQTLLGFGASSIGRFSDGYVQNTVPTHLYQQQIAHGILPKNKGLALTIEDRLRGHIIERLMCDFEINFAHQTQFPQQLVTICLRQAHDAVANDPFGLCEMDGDRLIIRSHARAFVRIVAAQFDAYYAPEQFSYSKAV